VFNILIRMVIAAKSGDELLEWMSDQDFPYNVIQSFKGKLI